MKMHEILTERFVNLIGDGDQVQKHRYKQQVFDILQRTYASIGGIKGSGFDSADDMVTNIPFWKLALKDGKLVAVILYKDKTGRKSVASGSDGTTLGMLTLKNMIQAEPDRSYAEKSKAALAVAMKSLTPEQQKQYLITTSDAQQITGDQIIPIKNLPESDWPISGDSDEVESTRLTLQRYPQLWDYGYFREIGGSYKFKVMIGSPHQDIS